jgi:hypothetical protein
VADETREAEVEERMRAIGQAFEAAGARMGR